MAALLQFFQPVREPSYLTALPTELLLIIADDLPVSALCALQQTCKLMHTRMAPIVTSRAFSDFHRKYIGSPSMYWACCTGNSAIARSLLSTTEIHSSTKNRILYICSSLDRVAIVHMLLEYGGDVNATSGEANNKTLLHRAAGGSRNRGSPKMVELLIKCGADVAAADWKGKTPLHLACRNIVSKPLDEDYPGDAAKRRRDNMEVVRLLIANGAPLNAVDPSVGFTPLHTVCWGAVFGHYEKRGECMEAAKVLILSGAKLDVPSKEGKTALDILDEGRKRMSAWSSGYWFTACWFWCVKASGLKGSRLPGRATRPRCLPSTAALGEDQ